MPAEVSSVVLRYSENGAKNVQRADRNVRDSISETAKTAKQESGEIDRWMTRHKTALLTIGAAVSGLMAGIIQSTPGLRAGLSSIRLVFSLLAMEIGQHLVPYMLALEEAVWDGVEAWDDLDDSLTDPIEKLIAFGAVAGTIVTAIGVLSVAASRLAGALRPVGQLLRFLIPTGVIVGALVLANNLWKTAGALAAVYGGSRLVHAIMIPLEHVWKRLIALPVVGKFVKWAAAGVAAFAAILGISTAAAAAVVGAILAITAIGIWNDRFGILHDTIDRFLGRFTQTFGVWADLVTGIWESLMGILTALTDSETSVIEAIVEAWKRTFVDLVTALAVTFVNIIGGLVDLVILLVVGFVSGVIDIVEFMVRSVITEIQYLASLVPRSFDELRDRVIGTVSSLINGIIDWFRYLFDVLVGRSLVPDLVSSIIGWFETLGSRVLDLVAGLVGDVADWFAGLAGSALGWGRDLIDNFVGRLDRGRRSVSRSVGRVVSVVEDLDMGRSARRWGRDIGDHFRSGLRSMRSNVSSAASSLRSSIERHLSFDRIQNDRMAERWGADLVDHFSKGLHSEWRSFERGMPRLDASMMATGMTPGAGGGSRQTTNVTIEQGAIQIRGGRMGSGSIDERELAGEIADQFGGQLGGRTR